MQNWKSRKTEELFKTILRMSDLAEARCFFRDLMTEREIIEFGNRWQAARLLDGGVSYEKISQATGLSTRTIARISKWLKNGMGGYRQALKKNSAHHAISSRKRSVARGKD